MGPTYGSHKSQEAYNHDPSLSLESVYQRLQIETKIKLGAENMLHVFDTFQRGDLASRREIELQLEAANNNIAALTREVEHYENQNLVLGKSDIQSEPTIVKGLPEFEGRDTSQIIEEIIAAVLKPNSDSQMRSVALKKFINWLDLYQLDLSNFEAKVFLCLRKCCSDMSRELRALAMRAFRHVICLTHNLRPLFSLHFEYFIIRFLTVETNWEAEKEQAILLIRMILMQPEADKYLTDGIIRAVCSIAEQSGDKHRTICVELLCELLVFNTDAVSRSGGIRIIIHSLLELPYEMSKSIVQLLLALLDKPKTRCYFRPGADFEPIFSVLNDSSEKTRAHREKLKTCTKLILEFLRNWNGIMYLCVDNKRAARSIVDALAANAEDTRVARLSLKCSFPCSTSSCLTGMPSSKHWTPMIFITGFHPIFTIGI